MLGGTSTPAARRGHHGQTRLGDHDRPTYLTAISVPDRESIEPVWPNRAVCARNLSIIDILLTNRQSGVSLVRGQARQRGARDSSQATWVD